VTEIESWLRDPYAIYARHVLRVRPLAELEEEADHALFGNLVHDGLAHAYGAGRIDEAGLADAFETALGRLAVRPGIAAWWRPRLARIAAWVAEAEAARVAAAPVEHRVLEIKGSTTLRGPAGPFELTGRADRIERRAGAIAILDYKTGTVPAHRLVLEGWSPQLPLEATMARLGAFGDAFRGLPTGELAYWKLSGGTEPGKEASLVKRDEIEQILGDVWHGLECRIEEFDDPETAYLAQPWPAHAPAYDNYGVLARVAEWRVTDKNEP
jgi:ATP-dependent helicase/nuclease subunit B